MIFRNSLLAAACILLVLAAGCTGTPAQPGTTTPSPATTAPSLVPPVSPAAPAVSPSGTAASSCSSDVCSVIPTSASPERSLRITAAPQRYSPMMSSTPGIGLEPVTTGFNATAATFTWNASYGQFLSWGAPDYTVDQLGASATGPGKKLYWSFTDKPSDTKAPVSITVTAKDPASGDLWGTAVVTLVWDGDNAVTVQQ